MTCHIEQRKFLAAAALAAALAAAWSNPAQAETARVRTIRVSELAGDTDVVIAASARPTFTTWKLEQPARVIVELSGTRLGDVDVPLDAGTYAVGLVTASVTEDDSAGPRTRIVLTLRQTSDYRVEAKGNDITVRVIPRVHPLVNENIAETRVQAEARAKAEAQARVDSRAKDRAEAKAEVQAQVKAEAETQAKLEAQARAKAEAQAKLEAQARAKAEAQAKEEEQARAKAEAQAKADAQARARVEAQAKTEAEAKVEAEAEAKAEAKAKVEAQAQAKAELKARLEAQARAETETKVAAQAKAEAETRAEAQAKAEASAKAEKQARLAAQASAEERARAEARAITEADRLRGELVEARRETEKAQAMATVATEESRRQKLAVAHAEDLVKQAQSEAGHARKRAESAEHEVSVARQREMDHDKSLRVVAEEVETRQKALDQISKLQEQQRTKLAEVERLVTKREVAARATEAKLLERDAEARMARARRDSLARDASLQSKAQAAAAVAEAERQRQDAIQAAERSRQDLAVAVSSRKQEEERKNRQAQQRQTEESKFDRAVVLRKEEESRLADARAERTRLDGERAKLEGERSQLEAARNALLVEVGRLKEVASATRSLAARPAASKEVQPSVAVPAAKNTPVAAAPVARNTPVTAAIKPEPVKSGFARPRSVTLRAVSHIRSIDFVDEPSRASVIIDVEDGATFAVERIAGRRLSLRIDHSDLADGLERNLDATEYLGPVKVISSYRDPGARSTVRVDVDLAEDVPNRIRQDGSRIYWDFQKAQTKAPSLPAVWVPRPDVRFVRARKVAGFVAITTDPLWVGQNLPPFLETPSQSASRVPLQISPEQSGSLSVGNPADNSAASAAGTTAQDGRAGPGAGGRYTALGKKRYTGRRIDLDFKGADIHNILRLLADVGQVNIVVADDVKGDVTIKMRDVPWDQALDVVLRSKGLGSVREGNLLRVAPLSFLEKELEAEIARQKQIADVLPTETRLIGVSYADATHLQDKARDILSPRGKLSVDTRTNTLIVSDVAKNLQLIEDLVRNLDTQTSQVVIEARIVEANSNFTRQIGVQWGGTAFADTAHANPTGLVFPYNVGIGGGADDPNSPIGGLVPGPRTGVGTTGSPNFLVNMPASAGLGTGSAIGLTLGSVAGAFNLNLRLSAMESTGQVRVLSSPRVTTMDNLEARILQGVSIPVSVVSAMGAQTQFVDAQLSLVVKPHVTNEGTIAMSISVTNNAPDFSTLSANGTPAIDKKETKTTMLVRDGDTAVIGGIYTRTNGVSYTKVPYFADIPVLGWFFRSRKENDNRSEFLVFITPRIVNRSRALGQ